MEFLRAEGDTKEENEGETRAAEGWNRLGRWMETEGRDGKDRLGGEKERGRGMEMTA